MQSLKSTFFWAPFILLFLLYDVAFPSPPLSPIDTWHISAIRMSYDQEKKRYIAEDDVVVKGGTIQLQADHVEFSNETRNVTASGHVILTSNLDIIHCDALDLNLESEIGTLYNGVVFIEENHFYIRGDTIKKSGKNTYEADRASLTSCPGERPDWKISAKDIRVTLEGYGVAKSATLWAKNIPALYSPIVAFPVKNKRQTGLLAPQISSSDRKGLEIEQPLFLAISREMDATLYTDYMHKRGVKTGVEFRYVMDKESRATVQYDYLHDLEIDDGTPTTSDFQVDATPQRSNRDRYWFRMKGNHNINQEWSATWDIDYVSDADYLHEFKSGYTGFTRTRDTFKETYGRDLDEYDDTTRKNSLKINKLWPGASLNMDVLWYDNVLSRQFDATDAANGLVDVITTNDTTLQRLPTVQLNTVKHQVSHTPLYFDLDAEYTYFYRKQTSEDLNNLLTDGQSIDLTDFQSLGRGHRSDIHPTISLPFRNRALFFEPSIGFRQTLWYADTNTPLQENQTRFDTPFPLQDLNQSLEHREMMDVNIALSTTLYKIYTPMGGFAEKVKHEITPKIAYQFIPDVDQEDLPSFDNLDFIDNRNHLTWTLTSRFTSRNTLSLPSPKKGEPPFASPQYQEFAWIELSQSYALDPDKESNTNLFSNTMPQNEEELSRRFSDISAEIELTPASFISLKNDFKWSPYDNRFNQCHTHLSLQTARGDMLSARYGYDRAISESLYTKLQATLTPTITAFAVYEENLMTHEPIESLAGFNLTRPCWSFRLAYSDTPDDRSFSFRINLHGLGEVD